MSNIERKYEYHDDGILPEIGDYGITYLTIFSSGAGNVYDGWIWDPDRKNHSEIERTFGYRNPDYPDYCWDDEVVVDLSNAQNRQESSEFEQGRITSFNTNVSDQPIILQDAGDISGLTEDQRERMATTVLFSAIPLIKDAYIHAEVEVAMKMNLSSNNTSGRVRIESFYILNDSSDRTMRPHPINHYSVATENEWNLLRLLYWNPALKHEDLNYIGVKLLCSGGTAEIGISDNPEYGDAIITLTSAGLVGDHIDEKRTPVSLDIFGKDKVPFGTKLNIDDYTVLCEYDDGSIFEVTRLCDFTPDFNQPVIEDITLTAYYMGLSASMLVETSQLLSLELRAIAPYTDPVYVYAEGDRDFQTSYTLVASQWQVLGYFEDDVVIDVTEQSTFNVPMGTTITTDTSLIAYFYNMASNSYTMRKYSSKSGGPASRGLIYTVYPDRTATITGNIPEITFDEDEGEFEYCPYLFERTEITYATDSVEPIYRNKRNASLDGSIWYCGHPRYLRDLTYRYKLAYDEDYRVVNENLYGYRDDTAKSYDIINIDKYVYIYPDWDWSLVDSVEWKATGTPLGMCFYSSLKGSPVSGTSFINFNRIDTSKMLSLRSAFRGASCDLSFINTMSFPALVDMTEAFRDCSSVGTVTNIDAENLQSLYLAFSYSTGTISDNLTFNSTKLEYMTGIFTGNTFNGVNPMSRSGWSSLLRTVKYMDCAFEDCTLGTNFQLGSLSMPELICADGMFAGIICNDTAFISSWQSSPKLETAIGMFAASLTYSQSIHQVENMRLNGFVSFFNTIPSGCNLSYFFSQYNGNDLSYLMGAASTNHIIDYMFYGAAKLTSLNGLTGIGSRCVSAIGVFAMCTLLSDISAISGWMMSSCESIRIMFYKGGTTPSVKVTDYGNVVDSWATSSMKNISYAFYKAEPGKTSYSPPYNISALYSLNNWVVSSLVADLAAFDISSLPKYETPSYVDGEGNTHYMEDEEGHMVSVQLVPWYQNTGHRT